MASASAAVTIVDVVMASILNLLSFSSLAGYLAHRKRQPISYAPS